MSWGNRFPGADPPAASAPRVTLSFGSLEMQTQRDGEGLDSGNQSKLLLQNFVRFFFFFFLLLFGVKRRKRGAGTKKTSYSN